MLRFLALDFRADPRTYDIRDQFIFGPALLLNPVAQPMYHIAGFIPVGDVEKTRLVYLPAGSDW